MLQHEEPIYLKDWSKVPELHADLFRHSQRPFKQDDITTFGLHFYQDKLWTGPYVGVGTSDILKLRRSRIARTAIMIQPRFGLDPWEMFDEILDDEEFPSYLSVSESDGAPLFRIFTSEKPIVVPQQFAASGKRLLYLSFINSCYALCRKGLKRSIGTSSKNYTSKIRGRINITKNLQLNTSRGRNDRFFCEFPDFTEDNIENRILKSALNRTSQHIRRSQLFPLEIEKRVRYCSNTLRHVSEAKILPSDFRSSTANGLYSYYRHTLHLAEFILKEQFGIPDTKVCDDHRTAAPVVPYMINMQLLFELFCRARLKKTLSEDLILDPYTKEFRVWESGTEVDGLHLSNRLIPDLIIRRRSDDSVAALFDAKYKQSSTVSREDTLQILAYSLATGADEVGFMFPPNDTLASNFGKGITLSTPLVNGGIPYTEYPVDANFSWKDRDARTHTLDL